MNCVPISVLSAIILPALLLAAAMPFSPERGLVEIEVTINGRATGIFGLDTGADRMYLDKAFAEEHGIRGQVTPDGDVLGIDGRSQSSSANLRVVEIGDLPILTSIDATVIDLSHLTGVKDHRLAGLIGHDLLSRFFVTIDYPGETIELGTKLPRSLAGKPHRVIPFRLVRHFIVVDAVIDGEYAAPMVLDYCATHTFVTPQTAAQMGLDGSRQGNATNATIAIAGLIESTDIPLSVSSLSNLSAAFGPDLPAGLLGGNFLKDHVLTIDYAQRVIYVHSRE